MAQFDVHKNPGSSEFPLVVDVQSDVLDRLATRVVAPLVAAKRFGGKPITCLNPTVTIGGTSYVVVFQELAGVASTDLGARVASLAGRRADLIAALDLLFTGI